MALDEAHIIRNPATSASQGAATLSAGGSGGSGWLVHSQQVGVVGVGGWYTLSRWEWVVITVCTCVHTGEVELCSSTSVSVRDLPTYV